MLNPNTTEKKKKKRHKQITSNSCHCNTPTAYLIDRMQYELCPCKPIWRILSEMIVSFIKKENRKRQDRHFLTPMMNTRTFYSPSKSEVIDLEFPLSFDRIIGNKLCTLILIFLPQHLSILLNRRPFCVLLSALFIEKFDI